MTTFSCAVNRKNIGESTCVKGKLENPSQIILVDDSFTFTQAQANSSTFWAAAIKAKTAVLVPKMFNFESAPVEAGYEETQFGSMKSSQGKYGFRILYNVNIERHKNIFSWDGSLNRHVLFDDQGKMMATLIGGEQADPADNTYTGMTPQMFSVENQIVDPGETTKTPVRVLYEDPDEWNVNGFIFTQSFLSQLKSLTSVVLEEVSSSSSQIVVSVTSANDGSPIRGLLFDAFSYSTGAIADPATESSAGVYALDADTTFATGVLSLVDPSAQVQFIEGQNTLSISI